MRFEPEQLLQRSFVLWLDSLSILYSASCGGMRTNIRTAKKMKESGYKKGCPDIMIFEAMGGYHGLMIELKSKTGKATTEQKEWKKALEIRSYKSLIMPRGFEHEEGLRWLINSTCKYLGRDPEEERWE